MFTPAETNLPVVEEAQATGAVADVYAQYLQRSGRQHVPGILKCFATHPPLLQQMMAIASSLLFCDGHLTRRIKEMIATYVSALNACPYCLDSHASFLQQQGGNDALLQALSNHDLDHTSVTNQERSLLQFVHKINCDSYKVCSEDIHVLRAAAWSEPQIAEAIHVASLFACFNRVANAFGLASQGLLVLNSPQEVVK